MEDGGGADFLLLFLWGLLRCFFFLFQARRARGATEVSGFAERPWPFFMDGPAWGVGGRVLWAAVET